MNVLCLLLLPLGVLPKTPAYAQTPAAPATPTIPSAPAAPPATDQFPDSPGQAKIPVTPSGPTVVIDTSMGRLTCRLFSKEAPVTSANFTGLAEGTKDFTDPLSGKKSHGVRFYDGTIFHRVIPGFMIQGGDRRGDGTGDGGFFFDQEIVPNIVFDVPGRMAMANAGPNTNGTQFFITEGPQPDLDGKYNIFGQCDAHSILLVASIARVDRDSGDKPTTPVTMTRVTVVREGQAIPPEPVASKAATAPSPVN